MYYQFELSGNIPSKKNSKRIVTRDRYGRHLDRPRLLSSESHESWHPFACLELRGQVRPTDPIKKAKVEITLYNKTKSRGDLTNKAESVMDLLVDMEILEDDNWFVVPNVHLLFGGVDKDNPRAIIKITPIKITDAKSNKKITSSGRNN